MINKMFKNQLALRAPNPVLLAENDEKDLLSSSKEAMGHVVEQEDSEEDSDNPHPDLLVSEVISDSEVDLVDLQELQELLEWRPRPPHRPQIQ